MPAAEISYDRYHVVALANVAMDQVRREEMRDHSAAVTAALGDTDRTVLKGVMWGMRKNPSGWTKTQIDAMHWLLQQAKRAARGYRNVQTFIAIAYLRMSKLKHLPQSPFVPAKPYDLGRTIHLCT